MWEIKLQKIVANLFIRKGSKIVHDWHGRTKFLAVLKSEKILFAFPNRYFTENNRRVPLMYPDLHSVELETNIDTKCQTDFC